MWNQEEKVGKVSARDANHLPGNQARERAAVEVTHRGDTCGQFVARIAVPAGEFPDRVAGLHDDRTVRRSGHQALGAARSVGTGDGGADQHPQRRRHRQPQPSAKPFAAHPAHAFTAFPRSPSLPRRLLRGSTLPEVPLPVSRHHVLVPLLAAPLPIVHRTRKTEHKANLSNMAILTVCRLFVKRMFACGSYPAASSLFRKPSTAARPKSPRPRVYSLT